MNEDLKFIEQGIDINEFTENMNKRNLELEFQIIRVRGFISITYSLLEIDRESYSCSFTKRISF